MTLVDSRAQPPPSSLRYDVLSFKSLDHALELEATRHHVQDHVKTRQVKARWFLKDEMLRVALT